jgi:hypothetical protein
MASGIGATRRVVRKWSVCVLVLAVLTLTGCACGTGTDTNPLTLMAGTWVQDGTWYPTEGEEVVSKGEVTCEPVGQGYGLFCHGYPSETFGFMDVFDWDPKTKLVTKRSLLTVPGERVVVMTGSWNAERRQLNLRGHRQGADGQRTVERDTRSFKEDGSWEFRYYYETDGKEILSLDLDMRPK